MARQNAPGPFGIWRVVPGDIAVVPLQMREVIGLTWGPSELPCPSAPEMTADSGWRRDGQVLCCINPRWRLDCWFVSNGAG